MDELQVWASQHSCSSSSLCYSTLVPPGLVQEVVWRHRKEVSALLLSAHATQTRGLVKRCGHRNLKDLKEQSSTAAVTSTKLL